ncbi:sialate O-acetylesterase [Tamlana sp. 2201CG12-4]|uniref:sialate O-acetylesterase n=1 Tax=Tamlana sp. 2201CG12-4 TaxID=3112582 RepID=UPI002DBDF605|nr:sialate O-acetylesterase [Tamlana sp. 2201CG12-4]MEC3908463.1 sialate O-acetylesterase [Tamlana sp. 2201CG12-4]
MKNKINHTIIVTIIALGISSSVFSNETIDLFIWAGQSNAQSWTGDANFYPADVDNLDNQVKLHWTFIDNSSSNGWETMQPQTGLFPKGHFGPEVMFGRKLIKAGFNPAIFKYTKGGTSIYADWKKPGKRGYYDDMIINLHAAIHQLESQGYKVLIRGFIWIQGESDADKPKNAKAYYKNLKQIVNHLRNRVLKNKSIPVILGVDEQHPWVVKHPKVVSAHKKIAKNVENVVFTSMIGLPKSDTTHLTPNGLILHGERIFKAYISINRSE